MKKNSDPKIPEPAPNGYQWYIREHDLFEGEQILELHLEDSVPDTDGYMCRPSEGILDELWSLITGRPVLRPVRPVNSAWLNCPDDVHEVSCRLLREKAELEARRVAFAALRRKING